MSRVVDLEKKFSEFDEYWSPHLLGKVNDCAVKVAKFKGEFPWHAHESEDELFFVVRGKLTIRLRDKELNLNAGQFTIIEAGVEHQPYCEQEAWVMMFEPDSTTNTGNLEESEFTKTNLPKI